MKIIQQCNEGALALRSTILDYKCYPGAVPAPELLSKAAPYYGYVDINVTGVPDFVMFSNNDDFVAQSFFWGGADAYEAMSVRLWAKLAQQSPGILDIGSYSGLYSLVAAKANPKAKCFAFEGLDRVFTRTLINKKVNNVGNLTVYNAAMSDVAGELEFHVYAGDSVLTSGSSIMDLCGEKTLHDKKRVKAMTIDSFVAEVAPPAIRLIKIDAEGAEHLVLGGGMELIKAQKPTIICELLKGAETAAIEGMLQSLGYRFYSINDKDMTITERPGLSCASDMHDLNYAISTLDLSSYA